MTDEFDEFAEAMRQKFRATLNKDKKRSPEPWKSYSLIWLGSRLYDEIREMEAEQIGTKEMAGELVDIAEFCMFMWKKIMTA